MAIVVKHAANPSVQIAASFAAGQAQDRKKAERLALEVSERRRTVEGEQAFRREMATSSQDFQRQMAGEAGQRRLGEMGYGAELDMAKLGASQDFRRQMLESGQMFTREQALQDQIFREQMQERGFDLQLTAEQRAKENQLRNAIAAIQADPGLNEAQKQEGMSRALQQFGQLKPIPKIKEPSEYAPGQGINESWTDEMGNRVTRLPTGEEKIMQKGPDTVKLYGDLYSKLAYVDPETKQLIPPSEEQMRTAMRGALSGYPQLAERYAAAAPAGGAAPGGGDRGILPPPSGGMKGALTAPADNMQTAENAWIRNVGDITSGAIDTMIKESGLPESRGKRLKSLGSRLREFAKAGKMESDEGYEAFVEFQSERKALQSAIDAAKEKKPSEVAAEAEETGLPGAARRIGGAVRDLSREFLPF